MVRKLLPIALVAMSLPPALTAVAVRAADAPAAKSPLPTQPGDDPVQPFVPERPRTEKERKRIDAAGWYMTGRLRESRNDFRGALEAYEKALDLDPSAVEVYKAYIPLAANLDRTEEVERRVAEAVKLDPDDHELLQQLGRHLAQTGEFDQSVELLEKAAKSRGLDEKSFDYVRLMRDLSVLYGATGNVEKRADAYEVVFEALEDPDAYGMDPRERDALQGDRAVRFETMGDAFLAAERRDLAIRAYEKAVASQQGEASSLAYNLANVQLEADEPEKALEHLQTYLDAQQQSKGRAAYELLAKILEKLGKSDELVDRLETLSEKDPRNNTLLVYLADQYVENEDLAAAEKIYRRAYEENGERTGLLGLLRVHRMLGRPQPALDALLKAFELARSSRSMEFAQALAGEVEALAEDEKLVDELLEIGRRRAAEPNPTLDFDTARLLAQLAAEGEGDERTEAAIEFYREALALGRASERASVYGSLGQLLLDAEKYDEAAEVFEKAVEDVVGSDQKAQLLYRLSQAREMGGNTDAALEAIARGKELLPDNPLLEYQHGWIHYHAGQWDEAIAVFQDVLEKHEDQAELARTVRLSLSNIYVQKKEIRKAEQVLEVILEQDPDDPSVNNDLGYLYADQGKKLKKAEKMIRIAVEAEPENAAYLDSMGWVLYRRGKFEEAVGYLKKAVELPGGGDPTIWDHLGDAYHELGKTDEAVDAWQNALEAFDDQTRPDEELRAKIQKKLDAANAK